jgi:hypothetical protein
MLDQLDVATLSLLGVALLLVVLLFQSIRMRRMEGLIRSLPPVVDVTTRGPGLPADPTPPLRGTPVPVLLPPASKPATAEQVESLLQRLERMDATLSVIAAGERALLETTLLDWSFDEATSLIRGDDRDAPSDLDSVVCRFLRGEAPEHTKLFLELIEKGQAAAIEVSTDVTALSLQLASCGIHIAVNGHFLIGSVVAILAHAKFRQLDRKVDHVKDQLQFLIDARSAEHDINLRSLWDTAREQSSRPREPGARRNMRHIAEELSRQRFIWIYDFHQAFISAARHMYKSASDERSATESHVPSCRATTERLVIAITLDYFVRLALEEPKEWLNARLIDEANYVKRTINRCLTEWRNHRPKKRSKTMQWNDEARLRRHQTMSQAIGQLRLYQRVLIMLAKAPASAPTACTSEVVGHETPVVHPALLVQKIPAASSASSVHVH